MFAILANLAMDCEFGKVIANLAMVCEVGKAIANLAMWFANLAMWFAKLAMRFAKLAMRNFAKLLKFYVRSEVRNVLCNVASEFRNGCELVANRLPISQGLPTGCQFRKGCQLIAN